MAINITLSSDDFAIDEHGNVRLKNADKAKALLDVVSDVKDTHDTQKDPQPPVVRIAL